MVCILQKCLFIAVQHYMNLIVPLEFILMGCREFRRLHGESGDIFILKLAACILNETELEVFEIKPRNLMRKVLIFLQKFINPLLN